MADWSAAEAYARSFARLCAAAVPPLLDLLGAARGSLLDVGTGPGTLALAGRERGWRVTAVEPEPAMRGIAQAAGLDPVAGALPGLPFPDAAFEAVAANFVLNHVADPRASAVELRRVTAPGGTAVASIWGSAPGALSTLWARVLDAAGVAPLPGVRLPADRDFARTEAGLAGVLADGGFEVVGTRSVDVAAALPPADLWAAVEGGIGVIGTTWRAQQAAGRERLRRAFDAVVEPESDGLLHVPAVALLAAGRAGVRG